MRITYVGPYRAVDVPSIGMTASRDVPIEVPDEAAKQLLRQKSNWSEAKPEPKARPTTKAEEAD